MQIFLRVVFTVALFAWVAGFIFYKIKKSERSNDKILDDYFEKERAANHARRKDIDGALFFTADLTLLPGNGNSGSDDSGSNNASGNNSGVNNSGNSSINEKYERVLHCAEKKMIRFKERMSNVDLKMAYGPSQLEVIAAYEENFNEYLRALLAWAESLIENGITGDALRILEYTLELGSEFRRSYKLAADIYKNAGNYEKLNALLERAENFEFRDPGTKAHIVKHIMDLKESLT